MATLDLSSLDAWERSIRDNARTEEVVIRQRLVAVDSAGERYLQAITQPDWFSDVLRDFVNQELLRAGGELYDQFHANAGVDHYPMYRPRDGSEDAPVGVVRTTGGGRGGRTTKRRYASAQRLNMGSGFTALWRAIAQAPVVRTQGSEVIANVGPMDDILALRLSDFMGTQGGTYTTSRLNTLFYAVEYGTGIGAHVGAGFVNLDGRTKALFPPGAWFYENRRQQQQGGLFLGQPGFHFLYDERTRKPQAYYAKRFRTRFPAFVRRALGKRAGSITFR